MPTENDTTIDIRIIFCVRCDELAGIADYNNPERILGYYSTLEKAQNRCARHGYPPFTWKPKELNIIGHDKHNRRYTIMPITLDMDIQDT